MSIEAPLEDSYKDPESFQVVLANMKVKVREIFDRSILNFTDADAQDIKEIWGILDEYVFNQIGERVISNFWNNPEYRKFVIGQEYFALHSGYGKDILIYATVAEGIFCTDLAFSENKDKLEIIAPILKRLLFHHMIRMQLVKLGNNE